MDPQARHATWTVLQKFKQEKQCSILLTTHFMDEADFLGDRIAIMSRGQLRCCGSPLFLKSKYDSGYNLVINKETSNLKLTESDLSNRFITVIQRHIPNAKLNSNINSEISFVLPKEDASKFALLFDDLDLNKTVLSKEELVKLKNLIRKYRDVFNPPNKLGCAASVTHDIDTGDQHPINSVPYHAGMKEREAIEEQINEMLKKRCHYSFKKPLVFSSCDGTKKRW